MPRLEFDKTIMLWIRLAFTFNRIYQEAKRELDKGDITIPQLDIMLCLDRTKGIPLSELAERLLVTGGNITGVIDRLEREGYVQRERDEKDRRIVRAKLTEKGHEVCSHILPLYQEHLSQIINNLSPEEQRQLRYLLKKLAQGTEKN